MNPIIKNSDFQKVASSVKPDAKNRVLLKKNLLKEDTSYHIYVNRLGQIVLDPQASIPAYEAWLFNNPEAIASVRRGLNQAAQGKIARVDIKNL
ncbi:MAG: hypothetical protein C4542_04850 [Dehalococcoidia bacterium]|nr:MAG: hypothetical protein C4542_04850 [Dehalococcoidia bacterium]